VFCDVLGSVLSYLLEVLPEGGTLAGIVEQIGEFLGSFLNCVA
jgi:hypothetical protein